MAAWFWPLVESLGTDADVMASRFRAMPLQRLLAFRRQYDRARGKVNPIYRADFVIGARDCSEDHADDFAAWVVSRGRAFWGEVRRHPSKCWQFLGEFEPVEFEAMSRRPDFIAGSVFHERFGENIVSVLYHPEFVAKERQRAAEPGRAAPGAAPDPAT
ncbi:DUF4240 domain-containing protein [Frigoriglobus tundricola]|uniref:DUF4240 domain-containing protein n=1 Tax=Frigoriglobus tundricola TaxID=2774151 RepID=UPI00148EE05E|nr:DUF4240 domain-containing protein [Frigoriglobus tundricola]